MASIHWGGNRGYRIPDEQRHLAHALIDSGAAHVIHGHSSHHPKGVEIYRSGPVIYGCGDFLNDYEGISGHETYRAHLSLAYVVRLETPSGGLVSLDVVPFEMRRFSLRAASAADTDGLCRTLNRESARLGARVAHTAGGTLSLARDSA